jgi:hypothetical protein
MRKNDIYRKTGFPTTTFNSWPLETPLHFTKRAYKSVNYDISFAKY